MCVMVKAQNGSRSCAGCTAAVCAPGAAAGAAGHRPWQGGASRAPSLCAGHIGAGRHWREVVRTHSALLKLGHSRLGTGCVQS